MRWAIVANRCTMSGSVQGLFWRLRWVRTDDDDALLLTAGGAMGKDPGSPTAPIWAGATGPGLVAGRTKPPSRVPEFGLDDETLRGHGLDAWLRRFLPPRKGLQTAPEAPRGSRRGLFE
eukprot:scaffold297_cov171-Amphora_coffeaeformis.AAC.7